MLLLKFLHGNHVSNVNKPSMTSSKLCKLFPQKLLSISIICLNAFFTMLIMQFAYLEESLNKAIFTSLPCTIVGAEANHNPLLQIFSPLTSHNFSFPLELDDRNAMT